MTAWVRDFMRQPADPWKNDCAVALGRKRWAGKSKQERQDAARKAARARWDAVKAEKERNR